MCVWHVFLPYVCGHHTLILGERVKTNIRLRQVKAHWPEWRCARESHDQLISRASLMSGFIHLGRSHTYATYE